MSALDAGLRRLYENLAATGIPMFVGGSVAAMWYGEPRSTLDIDLVVLASPEDAPRIAAAFPGSDFYVPPLDVIRAELARGSAGQFNIIDLASGLKADIYVAGDDPLVAYGFAAATPRVASGITLNIAPATYVVAIKLRFYGISRQEKHLRDIRSVLSISPEEVDRERVLTWARLYEVEEAWLRCQTRPGDE